MAAIPCSDFVDGTIPVVPGRPKRANPDSIRDRFCQFVCSMDLSPLVGDETVSENKAVAWSLWDIPISHACQIDDDRGDDLICVSITNRIYFFDHKQYRDEWDWNEFAPIYKMMRIGPIPSSPDEVPKGSWNPSSIKRFSQLQFPVKDARTQGALSRWRISVGEWNREEETTKVAMRQSSQRMNVKIAAQGKAFVVTLEHAANEPVEMDHWQAVWDDIGMRVRRSQRIL